jgi:hypothetical protein
VEVEVSYPRENMRLILNNKVLTRENPQKRGRCGPSKRPLCFSYDESVTTYFLLVIILVRFGKN